MNQRIEYIGRLVTIRDGGTPKQFKCVGVSDVLEDCAVLMFDGRFHSKTVPFDRLELVPTQEERTPEHQAGFISLDGFRTTRDEATEWLAFVLLQAGMLFMNAPDGEETRSEILRLMLARGEREDGPVVRAAMAYVEEAQRAHDEMARDD